MPRLDLEQWFTGLTNHRIRARKNFRTTPHRKRLLLEALEDRRVLSADFTTYFGGSGNDQGTYQAAAIAIDASGNTYVAGSTQSSDFPTSVGVWDQTHNGSGDVYVSKFAPDGTLLWSTLIGGSGDDAVEEMVVDAVGNVYVAGTTSSTDFPTTPGVLQTGFGGNQDTFVTKLDPTGSSLIFSTYLGGSMWDRGHGMDVDEIGNIYVTGATQGSFPTTPGAFDSTFNGGFDGYITKLSSDASTLLYSTYLGGLGNDWGAEDVFVDAEGNAYVCGATRSSDFPTTSGAFMATKTWPDHAFVTKLNPSGSGLAYSTYLGGSNGTYYQNAFAITVDEMGSAYVTGRTDASNFPTTPGAFQTAYGGGPRDGYITKLDPAGASLEFSTFLGGNGDDEGWDIALDATGNVHVVGFTWSTDFPTTVDAPQPILGGQMDAFVATLDATGSTLLDSSYLGGTGQDWAGRIALDAQGGVHVTGLTQSTDFPVTPGAYDVTYNGNGDAFVMQKGGAGLINDPPILDPIGAKNIDEESLLQFTVTASDPNDDPPNNVFLSTSDLPVGASFNPATGVFSWTPTEAQQGVYSVTFTVTDDGAPNLSDSEVVMITVNEANDAPLAVDDQYTAIEDDLLTILAEGVLANDDDVEDDALTAVLASEPSHGTLTLSPDGSFTYMPNENFNGVDSFTYRAHDGELESNIALVTINVTAQNDAPVADDFSVTVTATSANISVLNHATDADGDTLSVASVTQGSQGSVFIDPNGEVVYTVTSFLADTDSFTYTVSDGQGGTATATVTIHLELPFAAAIDMMQSQIKALDLPRGQQTALINHLRIAEFFVDIERPRLAVLQLRLFQMHVSLLERLDRIDPLTRDLLIGQTESLIDELI